MDLAGQARTAHFGSSRRSDAGYAMAVLLVALGVMAVMLTAAMPVWKQMAQREKEEELIFRGQQYARAIGLFQRRAGPGVLPPNVDVLVQQRFLRKKYKDPITGDDFQLLLGGQAAPGTPAAGRGAQPGTGSGASAGNGTAFGRGTSTNAGPQSTQMPGPTGIQGAGGTAGAGPAGAVGGIQGVVSKSTAKSIRIYNGRSVYNEWTFVYVPQVQSAGGGAPGANGTGRGRGQQTPPPGGFPPGIGGTPAPRGNGSPTGPGGIGPGTGRPTAPGPGPTSPFGPPRQPPGN